MYWQRLSSRLASLVLLAAAASTGCAPMTFSNEGNIDFRRYPSITVEVAGPDGSQRQRDYLESELREHSGFRRVSSGDAFSATPPEDGAAAQLVVELSLDSGYEVDVFSDEDDIDVDVSYSASVRYRLLADGAVVDAGSDSVDDEDSSFDAAEAALDLVVLHYLRPYRL